MSEWQGYSGSGSKIEAEMATMRWRIGEVEKRLEKLEESVEGIRQRVAALKGEVDNLTQLVHDIRDDVKFIKKQMISNGRKYTLYVLAMVLSFIAAVLGLHWMPPAH